jgi:hypothetical protein
MREMKAGSLDHGPEILGPQFFWSLVPLDSLYMLVDGPARDVSKYKYVVLIRCNSKATCTTQPVKKSTNISKSSNTNISEEKQHNSLMVNIVES